MVWVKVENKSEESEAFCEWTRVCISGYILTKSSLCLYTPVLLKDSISYVPLWHTLVSAEISLWVSRILALLRAQTCCFPVKVESEYMNVREWERERKKEKESIYIYIYVCVCVCVCQSSCFAQINTLVLGPGPHFFSPRAEWAQIVGKVSPWLDLDSHAPSERRNSEEVNLQHPHSHIHIFHFFMWCIFSLFAVSLGSETGARLG